MSPRLRRAHCAACLGLRVFADVRSDTVAHFVPGLGDEAAEIRIHTCVRVVGWRPVFCVSRLLVSVSLL